MINPNKPVKWKAEIELKSGSLYTERFLDTPERIQKIKELITTAWQDKDRDGHVSFAGQYFRVSEIAGFKITQGGLFS